MIERVPDNQEELYPSARGVVDGLPGADSPLEVSTPLVFVPVEAADDIRRRRRRNTILIATLLVSVGTAAYLYKRQTDPIRAQQSFDAGVRLFKIARYPQAILAF